MRHRRAAQRRWRQRAQHGQHAMSSLVRASCRQWARQREQRRCLPSPAIELRPATSAPAATSPGAESVANVALGEACRQPKVQRQGDRRRRVLAACKHAAGDHGHDRTAPLTLVSPHNERMHPGLAIGLEDSPDLALHQPLPVHIQALAHGLAGRPTARAARGTNFSDRRRLCDPRLDPNRRPDHSALAPLSQESSEHDGERYPSKEALAITFSVGKTPMLRSSAPPPTPSRSTAHAGPSVRAISWRAERPASSSWRQKARARCFYAAR